MAWVLTPGFPTALWQRIKFAALSTVHCLNAFFQQAHLPIECAKNKPRKYTMPVEDKSPVSWVVGKKRDQLQTIVPVRSQGSAPTPPKSPVFFLPVQSPLSMDLFPRF
ncbi:hypothetical protein DQ04_20521000 [Trypanosoma grayi]|uniref:hypothetical protein n=1 Tax=Trypanosoma grayi TaxID=71804 RepID=UPI0004F41BF6|nr:hypothetical protein DQ04_20521000 [Trypanosoma grayi]KEG05558.1 hypothetical protein DQ04_20521000 [Trypanosoma grayi]